MSIFFDRFSALCKDAGETPNSLGKKLGISSGSITAWKKGTVPRMQTLDMLANYFHVSVDYLIGNVNDPWFYLNNEQILQEINSYNNERNTTAPGNVRKVKLRSVARLESADITPEMDKNITDYIEFLLKKREEHE